MNSPYKILRSRKADVFPLGWNGVSETSSTTKALHGINFKKMWIHFKDREAITFYLDDEWVRIGMFLRDRMINEHEYLALTNIKQKQIGRKPIDFSRGLIKEDISEYTLAKLFDLYKKTEDAWVTFDQWNMPPWFIGGDYLQEHVRNILEKIGVSDDSIAVLLTSPKLSFSSEEELCYCRVANKIIVRGESSAKLSPEIMSEIDRLVDMFYWIPFGYDGPSMYDQNHYKKTIEELLKTKSEKQINNRIEELLEYRQKMTKKQNILFKQHRIGEPLKRLICSIHTLSMMTDERKKYHYQANIAFDKVLSVLASKIAFDRLKLKYLKLDEIKKYSTDVRKLASIADKRINKPIIIRWQESGCEILSDKEVMEISALIFKTESSKFKSLHGSVGARGVNPVVRGKVLVLHAAEESFRMQEGDVLVTSMTSPEFISAMRKSVAIITDEGGVTCHAAIVSRELGKPCIIGTKKATKMLHDGDMVEVDTERGIVTILEKATKQE